MGSCRRNAEHEHDKLIGELEMKMMQPLKHQKYLTSSKSEKYPEIKTNMTTCAQNVHHGRLTRDRDRRDLNPELPGFVSDKYK